MLREFWADVRYRVRAVFLRSKMDDELDAELRFHLEREAEDLRRRGLTDGEARRQAHIAFGGLDLMKEETRDTRGTALLESLLQDMRYAVRTLRKEPTFTLTIVLLLALGIGANTATFSVMHALLFRPLAVPHPEQLVIVGNPSTVGASWHGSPQTQFVSFPLYQDVQRRTGSLLDLYAAGRLNAADVRIAGRPAETWGSADHTEVRMVTSNYFDVLQVPAFRGRVFTGREDASADAPVAVISDTYWLRGFARDPAAIGSTITVNNLSLTIIGVMPPGFGDVVGSETDMWVPIMLEPVLSPQTILADRGWSWLQMMGRLAPGATLAQARAAIPAIEADAARAQLTGRNLSAFESDLRDDPIHVDSGALGFSRYRRNYRPALIVVMCAVGLIVLIVCANVANLMLVRGVARTREMTVRMALGAGRRRLVRQLLVETLLLAGAGGGVGLFASNTGSHLLVSVVNAPISLDMGADANVLVFGAGLTLVCAILFGLVPAFKGTRVDVADALRAQGRNLVGTRARVGRFAAGRALVVVQITLSTVLLIGAGLLIRSMQQIVRADLGFDRDRLVLVHVPTQREGYTPERAATLAVTLPDRVGTLPGVLGASTTLHGLFTGGYGTLDIVAQGASRSASPLEVRYDAVGPGYFHAIGARILRGREFDARDSASAARVTILNDSLARYLFGDRDAVGATVTDDEGHPYTIVGVVGDMHESSVRDARVREAYIPISQKRQNGFWLAVHVDRDPAASIAALRRAVLEVDPTLPLEVHSFNDLAGESVAEDRLTMQVTAFFGIVALLLAALGLHGVTSYATSRRTGEFGLRMALGAAPESVARMVLRESAALGAIGLACGIPAGLAATRLIRDQIFGIGRIDPPSLAAAIALLVATTIVAAYLPARRAARVAPLDALRTE